MVDVLIEKIQESQQVKVVGLGIFRTENTETSYHPGDHTLEPSKSVVSFEENQQIEDDGFIAFLAQKNSTTEDEAKNQIESFVFDIKQGLKTEAKYEIEDFGCFTIDNNYKLQFKPHAQLNLNPDTFGLPEIKAEPIKRTEEEKKPTSKPQIKPEKPTAKGKNAPKFKKKKQGSFLLYVIIIFLAITLVASGVLGFLFPKQTRSVLRGILGKAPIDSTKMVSDTTAVDSTEAYAETRTDFDTTKVDSWGDPLVDNNGTIEEKAEQQTDESETFNEPKPTPDEPSNTPLPPNTNGKYITQSDPPMYYIVAGGFSNQQNAEKKYNTLLNKGYPSPKIAKPSGVSTLYRVTIGQYTSFDEAKTNLDKIQSDFEDNLWVLKY